MPRTRFLRRLLATGSALLLLPVLAGGWRWTTGNFATVEPGEVYRSAQLGPGTLSRMIRAKGIRTVLNLRGPNPDEPWYRAERAATLGAGATLIDIPLASDYWLTPEQAGTIVATLETCDRPVLIHCQFGAERTSLVSAIVALLAPGSSLEDAEAQFSPFFLFWPTADGLVMRGHLRQYERWLAEARRAHSAERFRSWLLGAYEPGTPNRSQWPYDPYPQRVVTPPPGSPR